MNLRVRQARIKSRPILNTLIVSALAFAIIFFITYKLKFYEDNDFWINLVSGAHNTLFDILIIGVLIFWLNRRVETRTEIHRYQEEIDVWKDDATTIAIKKNQMSIKRLNDHGVYNIDLSRSVLQSLNLTGTKLSRSNLSGAECFQTIFIEGNFKDAILDEANLKEANLTKAVLDGAKLRGTNLEYANLQEASLKGADFTNAKVANVNWKGAIYDDKTKFPYGYFDTDEMIYISDKMGTPKMYLQSIQEWFYKSDK